MTDVLYRLSDPEVPGADKLPLVEGAKPADAATIDKFATALRDGGYLPLNLEAADLGWSDRYPGNVTADVTVNTANPAMRHVRLPDGVHAESRRLAAVAGHRQEPAGIRQRPGKQHTVAPPPP